MWHTKRTNYLCSLGVTKPDPSNYVVDTMIPDEYLPPAYLSSINFLVSGFHKLSNVLFEYFIYLTLSEIPAEIFRNLN